MYPNPNPNQKNRKFGARNPTPFCMPADRPKRRRSAGLQKGLGFLDRDMYLTQYSEPALAGRSVSQFTLSELLITIIDTK